MRSSPDVDMNHHWKMVTVFIGANDLCSASCLSPVAWSPAAHARKLARALDYLHQHLPRTIVNLIPVLGKSGGKRHYASKLLEIGEMTSILRVYTLGNYVLSDS